MDKQTNSFQVRTVRLTPDQIDSYEKKRLSLMVPDPWTDTFCYKNKLVDMYIQTALAELMHLSAESEPGVKLNCPNPIYTTYHKLMSECFDNRKSDQNKRCECLQHLLNFLEQKVLHHKPTLVQWTNGMDQDTPYTPDIRIVNSVDEALGWLALHLNVPLRSGDNISDTLTSN